MARLYKGKKSINLRFVYNVLRWYYFGIREIELANELGWQRRTLNNYLRELQVQNRIYKERTVWYADIKGR